MPYSKECYERLVVYMQPLIWYPLDKLHKEVAAIESLKFSVPEEREMIRSHINRIVGHVDNSRRCPFDVYERFPEATAYAYVYSWEYCQIFTNMYKALDTKIIKAEDMMHLGIQCDYKAVEEEYTKAYNKTMEAFYDNLTDLKRKIAIGEHIYTYRKFEKFFKLEWVE